jgi:hypothetical protein
MSGNCKTCLYVVETKNPNNPDATPLRNCHRYPPAGFMATVQVQPSPSNPSGMMNAPGSIWPPVMEGQWCGEYAPKAYKGSAPS